MTGSTGEVTTTNNNNNKSNNKQLSALHRRPIKSDIQQLKQQIATLQLEIRLIQFKLYYSIQCTNAMNQLYKPNILLLHIDNMYLNQQYIDCYFNKINAFLPIVNHNEFMQHTCTIYTTGCTIINVTQYCCIIAIGSLFMNHIDYSILAYNITHTSFGYIFDIVDINVLRCIILITLFYIGRNIYTYARVYLSLANTVYSQLDCSTLPELKLIIQYLQGLIDVQHMTNNQTIHTNNNNINTSTSTSSATASKKHKKFKSNSSSSSSAYNTDSIVKLNDPATISLITSSTSDFIGVPSLDTNSTSAKSEPMDAYNHPIDTNNSTSLPISTSSSSPSLISASNLPTQQSQPMFITNVLPSSSSYQQVYSTSTPSYYSQPTLANYAQATLSSHSPSPSTNLLQYSHHLAYAPSTSSTIANKLMQLPVSSISTNINQNQSTSNASTQSINNIEWSNDLTQRYKLNPIDPANNYLLHSNVIQAQQQTNDDSIINNSNTTSSDINQK